MPETPSRRPPIDLDGAARYLGTSPRHLRRLASERRLTFVKVGAKVRFLPEDLDAWLATNRVEAQS